MAADAVLFGLPPGLWIFWVEWGYVPHSKASNEGERGQEKTQQSPLTVDAVLSLQWRQMLDGFVCPQVSGDFSLWCLDSSLHTDPYG